MSIVASGLLAYSLQIMSILQEDKFSDKQRFLLAQERACSRCISCRWSWIVSGDQWKNHIKKAVHRVPQSVDLSTINDVHHCRK